LVLAFSVGVPLTAAQATVVATVNVNANGATTTVDLAPGVYQITSTGTYTYDVNTPGTHEADALCSTPDAPYWTSTYDALGNLLLPPIVTPWEPLRYVYGNRSASVGLTPFTSKEPLDWVLELTVNGLDGPWVAAQPDTSATGIGIACDTATHTYSTVLPSLGGPVKLRIRDVNYQDNAGSLAVTITQLP
jgi:hypothetical protein